MWMRCVPMPGFLYDFVSFYNTVRCR